MLHTVLRVIPAETGIHSPAAPLARAVDHLALT